MEVESAIIHNFQPCVFPGLLQTRNYASALFSTRLSDDASISALLDFRRDRHRILTDPNPPQYVSIINESVFRHQVGDEAVMREQIRRVGEVARWDHVHVRVLPVSAGAHLGLAGSFVLMSLRPPGSLTVSVLELFAKSVFVDDEDQVAEHAAVFNRILDASLDETASLRFIDAIAS
nr:DUF5753 domain-containing protein [Actinomadura sp. KC216]